AFASFEPAPGPATTKSVFFDTEPAGLPPAARIAASASSRLQPSIDPVMTTVLPVNGPTAAAARGAGSSATTPASARSSSTPSPGPPGANQAASAVDTVGPTPSISWNRSGVAPATSRR